MNRDKTNVSARRLTALLASTAIVLQPFGVLAGDALPTGGQVVSGSAAIATSGTTMTVTQGSDRAIVNWDGFSVGHGSSVTFVQPGSSSGNPPAN
jgi:large exoprotein involved in heme utilization and adhesion